MNQEISRLKNRLCEARQLLDLVESSLDSIEMEEISHEEGGTPGYMTMDEARAYLNISRTKFYELRNQVNVPSFQVFGSQRFKREDLDEVMKSLRT